MNHKTSLVAVGQATSGLLVVSFVLCVGFGLIFPEYGMHDAWHSLLPGFEWISWADFFLGLAESYAYGWYIALIWVPLYNKFKHEG